MKHYKLRKPKPELSEIGTLVAKINNQLIVRFKKSKGGHWRDIKRNEREFERV